MVDVVITHDPSVRGNPDSVEFCESPAIAAKRAAEILRDAAAEGWDVDVYVCVCQRQGSVKDSKEGK